MGKLIVGLDQFAYTHTRLQARFIVLFGILLCHDLLPMRFHGKTHIDLINKPYSKLTVPVQHDLLCVSVKLYACETIRAYIEEINNSYVVTFILSA